MNPAALRSPVLRAGSSAVSAARALLRRYIGGGIEITAYRRVSLRAEGRHRFRIFRRKFSQSFRLFDGSPQRLVRHIVGGSSRVSLAEGAIDGNLRTGHSTRRRHLVG